MRDKKQRLGERLGAALGAAVVRRPVWTILLCLAAVSAVAAGGLKVRFSTDYRVFFSQDDPKLAALDALERVFTKTDNIIFVVAPRGEGDVFQPEALAAVEALTEGGWKLPYASRADSITNFQRARAEDDELIVEGLTEGLSEEPTAAELQRVREAALAEPLLAGSLLAKDARAAGVNITLRLPGERNEEVSEAAAAARALAAEVGAAHPGVEIHVSGMAMMNDAFMGASIQDMSFVFPLMAVVMLAALWFLLGSLWATFTVVALIAVSSAAALGVAGLLGYPLTPPSAASPTIVLTLAVADGVHIIMSMTRAMRAGMSQRDAIVESLRTNLKPVLLTSVTTAIGFLSLNFAEAPPFWHLANMTATGIAVALLGAVTLLPALLVLVPMKPAAGSRLAARTSEGLASFVLKARTPLLIGGLAIAGVLGAEATRLETNDQFVDYFDESIPFRPDTEFLMDRLSGIYLLEYAIGSEGPSGVTDPAYLGDVDRFATWLRTQPEVTHVYSVSDIVKKVAALLDGSDVPRLPDSQPLAAEALMLYEMSLPFGLDLTDRINLDKSATRMTVTVHNLPSAQLRAFTERTERWLRDHTPEARWAQATSPAVIFSHLSDRNTRAMMRGNLLSLLLISLCLVIALRSLGLGLVSLIPNLMPIAFAYGLWALIFGDINIVASVAGAVALGIIVDDTIHFLSKYQMLRNEEGLDVEAAVRKTLTSVGPALIVTTVVLVAGFGVLTLSAFQMTSNLGLFTAMVCVSGLAADLLVLPPLLLLGRRRSIPTPTLEGEPCRELSSR